MSLLASDPLPQSDSRTSQSLAPHDCYRVIQAGLDCIAADRATDDAVQSVVHAYVSLGLYGPARELLKVDVDTRDAAGEWLETARQLAKKPSGRVAYGAIEATFEAGLARVVEAQPHLASRSGDIRAAIQSCDVYRANDGSLHLAERAANDRVHWIGGFRHGAAIAAALVPAHRPTDQFCENYLIVGDCFGAVLRRLHRETSKMFMTFTPRLFAVEPDLRLFAASLISSERVDLLTEQRVHVFVGDSAMADLRAFVQTRPEIKIPTNLVCIPPLPVAFQERIEGQIKEMLSEQLARTTTLCAENEAAYESIGPAEWAQRFSNAAPRPLRVLGITSRFTTVLQFSMRDVKAAFERLGHTFETLIEPSDHDMLSSACFAKGVAEAKPDLFFVIDHHRAEYPGLLPKNVPYVCWVQDMLPNLASTSAGRAIGPMDFFLTPSIREMEMAYEYPPAQGRVTTTVTDDQLYSSEFLSDQELAPHRCDFSYVSNQSKTPEEFHADFIGQLPVDSAFHSLCDFLFRQLKSELMQSDRLSYPRRATDLLAEAAESMGLAIRATIQSDELALQYIHPLGELMFRQSALEWVAEFSEKHSLDFRLYGQGWENHPRLARFARGVAPNGSPLRAIYQAATINLQIIGTGAIHPRLLDGLAAGGFFLIRKAPVDLLMDAAAGFTRESVAPDWRIQSRFGIDDLPQHRDVFEAERILSGRQDIRDIRLDRTQHDHCIELLTGGKKRIAGLNLAGYRDVAFGTRSEFVQMAARFLGDPDARKSIATRMRDTVVSQYTYTTMVRDLLTFLGERLVLPPS